MWNLFDILEKILELLKIALGLFEQIQKICKRLKSGKRPSRGRSHSRIVKKKK